MYTNIDLAKTLLYHAPKKNRVQSLVQKRTSKYENEVQQEENEFMKPPHNYGDRFIPRRYCLSNLKNNLKTIPENFEVDIFNNEFEPSYWRQHSFMLQLNKIFKVEKRNFLTLSDPLYKFSKRQSDLDWECYPRSKRLAYAESSHDSPGFEDMYDLNMIDWSINGHIVASFGQDIIVWKRLEDITMLFNVRDITSVSYSPNGRYLAIGCKSYLYPVLELWDVSNSVTFIVVNGRVFPMRHSSIKCIEWTPAANQLVCGTKYGTIYVLSIPELTVLRQTRKYVAPLTKLKLSPKLRYLASGDADGNIAIYDWNTLDVHAWIRSRRNKDFDWHPWNGDELAIATILPAALSVLHVPTKKVLASYERMNRKMFINSISFNKITGELIVSITKRTINGQFEFSTLVMASLNRVVDLISVPEVGARFLMWSPDGTKLASTGKDGTLIIWNFCNKHKKSLTNPLIRVPKDGLEGKSAICTKFGASFRAWSCLK